MERKLEWLAEQSRNYEWYQYDSMGTRTEGHGPGNQWLLHDPSTSVSNVSRPVDLNKPIIAKPVMNYSSQTGEEFALEFMRERANTRKPFVPKATGDQDNSSRYMDLRGILGITHMGSEGGSDVIMLSKGDKGSAKEMEKRDVHESEEKVHNESAHSIMQVPSPDGSSRGPSHGYPSSRASHSPLVKVKILCSFGGKILPRPRDGKLRYVGGDTRIISISKNISWHNLMQKALKTYSQAHTIKYQLPGEDLDALVSVSCDEDLQNMMEECGMLDNGKGSQKLRMFLFSLSESEDSHFALGSMAGNSETQYVVAVNGMDSGQSGNSSGNGFASMAANDLDRLASLNTSSGWETSGVERESVHTSTLTSTGNLVPLVPPMQGNSLNCFETHVQSYPDQIIYHAEADHDPFSAVHIPNGHSELHNQVGVSSPMQFSHGYNSHNALFGESTVPLPLYELSPPPQGVVSVGINNNPRVQNSVASAKEVIPEVRGQVQRKNEVEQIWFADSEVVRPMLQHGISVMNHIPDEVSLDELAPERKISMLPSQHNIEVLELIKVLATPEALNASQAVDSNDNDQHIPSDGDPTELSYYETPFQSQRVFYSERIPRKQAESLNRLSKSDDNIGSQYLISSSGPSPVTEEPVTELKEGKPVSNADQSTTLEKPLCMNPLTIEEGLVQFEKYKELANEITNMNQNKPLFTQEGMDSVRFAHHGPEEDEKGAEMSRVKAHHKESFADETKADGPECPRAGAGTTKKLLQDPSSNLLGQQDIVIGINDHFPPDLLSDIFSKARIPNDQTDINPLGKDEVGMSLNIHNHDPKNWSFFRNLAPGEFFHKDVSLMDQDHIVFPSPLRKVEEGAARTHGFSPLKSEGGALGYVASQIDLNEEILQESSGIIGANTSGLGSDFIPSQVIHPHPLDKGNESLHIKTTTFSKVEENMGTPDSKYEEGKLEGQHTDEHVVSSMGDISDLQIIRNEDLEDLRELGSGTFGTVYHGKWRGTDVAIKRIKNSCFTGRSSEQERLTEDFWREAEILSKLHHPNVVAFYGVVQNGGTLATVTEFMVNGSLRHVLQHKDKYIDRRKQLTIAMDAAFGMEYLHSKNIVHFDLKCDNLLVNVKDPLRPICKVGDFGLSKIKRNTLVSGGVRGTLPWMAPELLNGGSDKVSEKVDVFSFGIVMWEILTGEEPYANMHYGAIIGGIVSNTLRPPVPNSCDPEWRRLMEQCWSPDPVARPPFTEIVSRFRVMSVTTQGKMQNREVNDTIR